MENSNNLDTLFQKYLNNLEVTPNKRVWNDIEAKLKKKKTRLFPFWWFSSSVAAILIIGLWLVPFSGGKEEPEKINNRVITASPKEKINPENNLKKEIDTFLLDKKNTQKILVADDDTNGNNQENYKTKKFISNKKQVLVANENKYITKNERKLVSTKNAMKKIFLADYSHQKNLDAALITKSNLKIANKEKGSPSKEVDNVQKKINVKRIDFNNYITKKDSVVNKKRIKNKWAVAPVLGVLSSNSFSNSSPINPNLSNSIKGRNTISYGVQVAYKINKKWSIKSGVHLQEMSYANTQVALSSIISSNSSSVVFNTSNSLATQDSPQNSDLEINSFANETIPNNNLTQNYGYIEFPLEVKYNLSNNRKLETELVAGFSSLFLNKNEIRLSNNFSSQSGEATNLNSINFSGNLGFDFNYLINKNWSINVNPMFKAQLNTFSNNANGFLPFNIGVYSGVKYQF